MGCIQSDIKDISPSKENIDRQDALPRRKDTYWDEGEEGAELNGNLELKRDPSVLVIELDVPIENELLNCTYKNTPVFTPQFTKCYPVKIYDGDTLHVAAYITNNGSCIGPYRFMVRMYGYDSPELKSKVPGEKQAGLKARDALAKRILGKILTIQILDTKDKYGRLLANLFDEQGSINEWMLENNYGKPYFGGTKEGF